MEFCLDIFIFLENTLGKGAGGYRWTLKVLWFTGRKSSEAWKCKQVFNIALQEFILYLDAKESDEQKNYGGPPWSGFETPCPQAILWMSQN